MLHRFRPMTGPTPVQPLFGISRMSLYADPVPAGEIPAAEREKIASEAVEKFKTGLPKVPEKYDLKLPDKSTLPAEILERTAATARKLGLTSNETAQQLVDFANGEVDTLIKQTVADYSPGGVRYKEQVTSWESEALKAPDLGGGKPEVLQAKVARVNAVVKHFFPEAARKLLDDFGIGSNPEVLRGLLKIADLAKEDGIIVGDSAQSKEKKSLADRVYGKQPTGATT